MILILKRLNIVLVQIVGQSTAVQNSFVCNVGKETAWLAMAQPTVHSTKIAAHRDFFQSLSWQESAHFLLWGSWADFVLEASS